MNQQKKKETIKNQKSSIKICFYFPKSISPQDNAGFHVTLYETKGYVYIRG